MQDYEADKVPVSVRIFYGIGSVSEGVKETAFNVFLLFFYNNVLGLPGSLAGFAIFIALCIDAITDPLMGVISDNTDSKWGRRHPYMALAALPVAMSFALLFRPPSNLDTAALFAWLLGFTVLLRVSLTLYAVPSNALAAELTSNYDERTEVLGIRFLFGWLAGLGMAVMGYVVYFDTGRDGLDGRMQASHYADFGFACALISALAIMLCVIGTRSSAKPHISRDTDKTSLLADLKVVWSIASFRALFLSAAFSASAWGYINAVGYYINTYFWELTTQQLGALTLGMMFAVMIGAGTAPLLGRVWDKRQATMYVAVFAIFFGPLPIVLRLIGWFPENGTRDLLAILLLYTIILTAAIIIIGILTASMLTDLTEDGEQRSGKRLEATFSSMMVFSIKASSGIGALLAGITLDVIHFPRQQGISQLSPDLIHALGVAYAPAVMVLYFISLIFLAHYKLDRKSHRAILQSLHQSHNPNH